MRQQTLAMEADRGAGFEQHRNEQLFAEVGRVLQDSGMTVKTGTIVDATLIAAPSSTKNVQKKRDPEMRQTRKGQQ